MEGIVLELLLTGTVHFKGSPGRNLQENLDDPLGGVAIPERRNPAGLALASVEFSGRSRVGRAKRRQVMKRAIREKA